MYQYGNVAVKYQNQNRMKQQNPPEGRQAPKRESYSANRDKMIALFALLIIIAVLSLLMARGVLLSELNYELLALEEELVQLEEENAKLQVQVIQLSAPERILTIAEKELGMNLADARSVKILSKKVE